MNDTGNQQFVFESFMWSFTSSCRDNNHGRLKTFFLHSFYNWQHRCNSYSEESNNQTKEMEEWRGRQKKLTCKKIMQTRKREEKKKTDL